MALPHVCLHCGMNLLQVRPGLDARFGVPVIVCPRCAHAVVRRTHPIRARLRAARRTWWPLAVLVSQMLLVVVFAVFTLVVIEDVEDLMRLVTRRFTRPDLVPKAWDWTHTTILVRDIAVAISLGAWLTAGLGHWRRGTAWVAWFGLLSVLLGYGDVLRPLAVKLIDQLGFDPLSWPVRFDRLGHKLMVLAMIMTVALAGIPIGRALRTTTQRRRSRRWRRRRAKLRRRRTAG